MSTKHTASFPLSGALQRAALAIGSLLLGAIVPAQKFQYDYGTAPLPEVGTCLVKVPAGYLIGGTQGSDVLGVLTNPNGAQILSARPTPLFAGMTLTPHCARRTAAGGIIASGEIDGGVAGLEVFLAFYAPNGALWPTGVAGPNKYLLYRGARTGIRQGTRVVEMSAGGFAVITNVDPASNSKGVLFTTGANGGLLCWTSYTYNGSPIRFHDLCQDTDGTFLIVGSLGDPTNPWRRTLVLRTSCGGAPIWAIVYGPPGFGEDVEQHAITPTAAGCFAVWGHYAAASLLPGSFLLEVNGLGGVVWRKHFPTIAGSRPTVARAANGDLLANGRVGGDALVLRTNSTGGAPVARTYGTAGSTDEIFQVMPTTDGGYAGAGTTQIIDTVLSNVYLVKADVNGETPCNWLPFPVTPIAQSPYVEPKQLQATNGGQMYYTYMLPPVPATLPTELCFTPGAVVYSGNAVSTTIALPGLTSRTPPVLGNVEFRIDAGGLVPGSFSFVGVSLALAPSPLSLSMLGGQPGSMLYCDLATLSTFLVLNDGNGEANVPLPIPNAPLLLGLPLHWQVLDIDQALPFPLPLGNSQAMSVVIQ